MRMEIATGCQSRRDDLFVEKNRRITPPSAVEVGSWEKPVSDGKMEYFKGEVKNGERRMERTMVTALRRYDCISGTPVYSLIGILLIYMVIMLLCDGSGFY